MTHMLPIYVSVFNYMTADGKYPERIKQPTKDPEFKNLMLRIDRFVDDLNFLFDHIYRSSFSQHAPFVPFLPAIMSGYRPKEVNDKTPGASPTSAHMVGQAVDFHDPNAAMSNFFLSYPEFLYTHDFWMEDPKKTPGWCHLDKKDRGFTNKIRVFK